MGTHVPRRSSGDLVNLGLDLFVGGLIRHHLHAVLKGLQHPVAVLAKGQVADGDDAALEVDNPVGVGRLVPDRAGPAAVV